MKPDLFSAVPLNSNDLAAVLVFGLLSIGIFGASIVKMLIKHQQHMAETVRQESTHAAETQALRDEVQQLKALIQQQTIVLDDLHRQTQVRPEALQERIR